MGITLLQTAKPKGEALLRLTKRHYSCSPQRYEKHPCSSYLMWSVARVKLSCLSCLPIASGNIPTYSLCIPCVL